ncbi:MAG: ribonuclease HII [Candidatus Moranbacteria bacterium]|nr:ribonuclease HII [Candidatus Moranbacteria bacterium]
MTKEDTEKNKYIIGIDEVGRGPIAGPVCVCAFVLKSEEYDSFVKESKKFLGLPLRDSKKLTKKHREKWFAYLKKSKEERKCDYAVSFVSNEMIDKFGIAKCIEKALGESLKKITSQDFLFARSSDEGGRGARPSQKENPAPLSHKVLLDGGLKAPKEFENQESFIKGDEIHPIISFASIVAKVSRDKVMENYAKEYKEYDFDKNVGYGTKAHYVAIKKFGQTPIHRKSFIH